MEDAGLEKHRIDEIVLIHRILCQLHESVAFGATVRGSILSGEGGEVTKHCFLYLTLTNRQHTLCCCFQISPTGIPPATRFVIQILFKN
ncbi:unnamed protein product [Musa banksii]